MPVHLYSVPADMNAIMDIARTTILWLLKIVLNHLEQLTLVN